MTSVYKLLIQILGRDEASDDLKRVNKEVTGLQGAAGGLSKAMQALGALGIGYMAKQAAAAVWDLGELGAQTLELKDAFQDLAGAASDDLLRAIKEATGGTVSEMDAMAAANKGILLGMGTDIEQWGQLTEVARFRARAMGIDVTQAISDIATGIGRESRLILDNLGIILDMDKVTQDYAATLGKTADELTAYERKQAIMNGVIEEGQSLMAQAGPITNNYADSFRELKATVEDAKIELAEGFASAIADVADALNDAIPKVVDTITQLWILVQAMDAQMRAAYHGADAQAAFENSILASLGAVRQQSNLIDGWMVQMGMLPMVLDDAAAAQNRFTASVITGTHAQISAMDVYEYRRQQLVPAIESDVDAITRINEEFFANLDKLDRHTQASTTSMRSAWDDLRSTIESALQPTSVTALDMGLTDIGQYVDKWDENARRLDAIAQRGFAELQAHADWASVLKIPPDVLAAGEDALKSWAQQTSQDVRNLFRPDLLNVEGAIAAVQHALEQEAAKELSLDIITQAVIDRGLVGGEDAKKKVAAALGLDQTYIGEEAGAQFMTGLMTSLQDTSLSAEFASYMQKDVSDSSGALKNSGEALWQRVELGIMDAMLATPYALEFARILAPYVAKELQEQDERGGK